MLRRIYSSLIKRPFNSIIFILILSILFVSLSTSFIWQDAADTIYSQINSVIKPELVIKSSVVIKNNYQFFYSPIVFDKKQNINSSTKWEEYNKDFYNDMIEITSNDDVYYSDNNMCIDSFIYLVPALDEKYLFIQVYFSVDDKEHINRVIKDRYEELQGSIANTLVNLGYYRLSSVSKSNFSDIFYNESNEDIFVAGRTFTDEEIENGEYKIILNNNAYLCDGETVKEVQLGDTITYTLFIGDEYGDNKQITSKTYDFEVIGILNNIERKNISDNAYNIIPENTFIKIMDDIYPLVKGSLYSNYYGDDYFVGEYYYFPNIITLSGLDELENVINKVDKLNNEKGRNYTYETSASKYIVLAGQIESVFSSFNILYYFSIIASIFILFSLITIDVSNRKKEIGILISLGEDRKSTTIGFILEYLFKILIALIIALIISYFVLIKLNSYILTSDIAELANGTSSIFFDGNDLNDTPVLSVNLSFINILKILLIVLAVSVPSIISSVLYISHFNPKEVLKDE